MNENWVRDETVKEQKRKAELLVKNHNSYERKMIKSGKKKVIVPHPTAIRCFIEKFV